MSDKMCTLQEASSYLRCCEKTVQRLITAGRLVAFRAGRRVLVPVASLRDVLVQTQAIGSCIGEELADK